jgi:hypothetical protein
VGGLNVFGGFLHHLVFGRAGRKSHPFIRSLQCRASMSTSLGPGSELAERPSVAMRCSLASRRRESRIGPSDSSDLSYGWEPPSVQAELNTSGDRRDVDGVPRS